MPVVRHCGSFGSPDYGYLDHTDGADLAWEWLRRDAEYRQLVPSVSNDGPFGCQLFPIAPDEVQRRWGCLNVASADDDAKANQLLWSAAVHSSVVTVAALPPSTRAGTFFDLAEWGNRVTIVRGSHVEYLLVRARRSQLRLDVYGGSVLQGPVRLFIDPATSGATAMSPAGLIRFRNALSHDSADLVALSRNRAHVRQVWALRTFDALADGASIRDIAITLFGEARVRAEWLEPGESMKSTCRRLIVLARRMGDGGYRSLLDPG